MISIRTATSGRVPRYPRAPLPPAPHARRPGIANVERADRLPFWTFPWRVVRWMYRGYTSVNASDMAAAVAFNTLIALVPMMLLLAATAGLFLKNDDVLMQTRIAIDRIVPSQTANDAFTAALTARGNTGWIGVISFVGLAWIGTGFVSCLARSMNKIYGARSSGYINEKQRGFFVLMVFSLLFIISSLASILPTFFISQELPDVFERWLLASGRFQLLGYGVGLGTSLLLFLTLYRVIPNAGQRLPDIWPGTLTSALLFMAVTQVFPLYIRLIGGGNRYGQVLGFVSLLVASLLILAHIILFGAYINASWQRNRRLRKRRQLEQRGEIVEPGGDDDLMLT
ncbi:MAG: YihY/virulence factor BrkB family protein [Chloroflexota bacterium]|nr:YihY/virulence factor BrkB family protein [Chloroflexota bacterium]